MSIIVHAAARIARSLSTGYGAGLPLISNHGIIFQKVIYLFYT